MCSAARQFFEKRFILVFNVLALGMLVPDYANIIAGNERHEIIHKTNEIHRYSSQDIQFCERAENKKNPTAVPIFYPKMGDFLLLMLQLANGIVISSETNTNQFRHQMS